MFQFAIFQFLNWVKLVCNLNRLLQFCCSLATLSTVFVEMIHFLASTTKVLGLWALPFDKLITPVWQLCNNFASKNFVPSYFLSYPSLLLLYPHVPGPVNQTSSNEKCTSKWITFSAILMIQLQHIKKNLILGKGRNKLYHRFLRRGSFNLRDLLRGSVNIRPIVLCESIGPIRMTINWRPCKTLF
jgi:hypothetical protein